VRVMWKTTLLLLAALALLAQDHAISKARESLPWLWHHRILLVFFEQDKSSEYQQISEQLRRYGCE